MYQRRLHILLDEDRYRRVAAEARSRGVPVARVIREAIDALLPQETARRSAAARRILGADPMPVSGPDSLRRELDELRARRA
ncbi:MAG TPA: antitoxin [Actinomycetota bacterium]|nr:antitoxin [Actinomycetota bacterium]